MSSTPRRRLPTAVERIETDLDRHAGGLIPVGYGAPGPLRAAQPQSDRRAADEVAPPAFALRRSGADGDDVAVLRVANRQRMRLAGASASDRHECQAPAQQWVQTRAQQRLDRLVGHGV